MKTLLFTLSISLLSLSCVSQSLRSPSQNKGGSKETFLSAGDVFLDKALIDKDVRVLEYPDYAVPQEVKDKYQRIGMFLESPAAEFKGCVIYLEGFGDSIINHYPLFNKIRKQGYRVIGFDYLGQGGSAGSLNSSSIGHITEQAKVVWDFYSKNPDPYYNRTCANSKKRVLAWSTGGLAAYKLAHEKWAQTYALLNPAIAPKWCVGESNKNYCLENLISNEIVTFNTLTRNKFDKYTNPHLEPVRPKEPLVVPLFVSSLLTTSAMAGFWKIDPELKILLLLSGASDAYVNTEDVLRTVDHSKAWFKMYNYESAYHELDNELPEVTEGQGGVHQRILDFLNDF